MGSWIGSDGGMRSAKCTLPYTLVRAEKCRLTATAIVSTPWGSSIWQNSHLHNKIELD